MKILETQRLVLRELNTEDAAFMCELMNEPAWRRFIGDRGIRTAEAAQNYIVSGPMAMYARLGFGLWLVELRAGGIPIGICGLIKRDSLADIDLGFAFLSAHWRNGYAFESAAATLAHGKKKFGLRRVVAIMSADNVASGRLLEKLGFRFERMIRPASDAAEVKLFAAAI